MKTFEQRRILGHPNLILETLRELAEEKDWLFQSAPHRLTGMNEWNSIAARLISKEFDARFNLQQMPGCCAVLIAYYIDVNPWTQEAFDAFLKALEEATYAAGFGSLMMAQVVKPGDWLREAWVKALDRGWEPSKAFINAKSGNHVIYLTKDMKQPGKRPGLEFEVKA